MGRTMNEAVKQSTTIIEETLRGAGSFRKVDERLFVIKQGSAYVMIAVAPWGKERALVRFTAQVVVGVKMTGELALDLLRRNASMRFGAFAYIPDGDVIAITHTLLGGATLDGEELLTAAREVADGADDELMIAHGGRRMQDVIEEASLKRLAASIEGEKS
jgi:hypothetical protein